MVGRRDHASGRITLPVFIRPLRNRPCTRTRQLSLPASKGLPFEQSLQVRVRVNRRGATLHQTARIGGGTIITILLPAEHAQQCKLLATMMGGVGHASRHHPGPRPPYVEKRGLAFPPCLILVPQRDQTFSAVVRIPLHELQPDFFFRQRRGSNVYVEHRSKPDVLADTLMHHMFMETAAACI